MSTVTYEARKDFNDRIKSIKDMIAASQKKEEDVLKIMRIDTNGLEYKKILLAEEMIYQATLYLTINNVSVELIKVKNNDSMNDARKAVYKALIYLEDVVSNTVDCPYSDLDERLKKISNTPIDKRYYIVRKLGMCIELIVDAFGDNSKWLQSFVELRGRLTVVAKNFIDMKKGVKDYFDPASNDHDTTVMYIRLIKKLLEQSSIEYRQRYETVTHRQDDIRIAINMLVAERRIAMLLGESDLSEEIRKRAVAWKSKMDNDEKSGASK